MDEIEDLEHKMKNQQGVEDHLNENGDMGSLLIGLSFCLPF